MTVLLVLIHLLYDSETRRRLISQFPGTLKARLLDAPPGALPVDLDAFLHHVASRLGMHAPGGSRAVRVVFRALREAVSPGELAKVKAHLPEDVAVFLERAE